MSKLPFLPLYTNDYLGDTRGLTTEQHGAYLLLLFEMWNAGGSLVYDERMLARLTVVSPKRWRVVWSAIEHFFIIDDGVMTQTRLKRERQKADSIIEKRRNAGALGGAAKALKTNDDDLANAKHMGWQTSAISQPQQDLEIEKEKEEPKGSSKKKAEGSSKGTRLPDDWLPSETMIEDALAIGENLNIHFLRKEISDEADRFRDYWIAQPGARGTKTNWNATWRNWIRRAAPTIAKQRSSARDASSIVDESPGWEHRRSSLATAVIRLRRERENVIEFSDGPSHGRTQRLASNGDIFDADSAAPF
jgi:uncharacterized protein YdaU (DUF1376 family)